MSRQLVQPIHVLFNFLQQKEHVQIWLYDNPHVRFQGYIKGFDEFLNVVMDDCVEVNTKANTKIELGKLLLKGECITLIHPLSAAD
jgi:small nuclear ribonucleoprotein E